MSENDIAVMEIEKLNMDIKRFLKISQEYSKKNVDVKMCVEDPNLKTNLNQTLGLDSNTDYVEVALSAKIPREILMTLYDIIQNFVQICDTHTPSKKLTNEERGFISGVRFVNNIIKHGKKKFKITNIIVPDFKVEVDNDVLCGHEVMAIPIDKIDFRLGAKWAEINDEMCDELHSKTQKQRPKYVKYLLDNDVIDTLVEIKKCIDYHYVK